MSHVGFSKKINILKVIIVTARNCANQTGTREKLKEFPFTRCFAAGQTGFMHRLLDRYFLGIPVDKKAVSQSGDTAFPFEKVVEPFLLFWSYTPALATF